MTWMTNSQTPKKIAGAHTIISNDIDRLMITHGNIPYRLSCKNKWKENKPSDFDKKLSFLFLSLGETTCMFITTFRTLQTVVLQVSFVFFLNTYWT